MRLDHFLGQRNLSDRVADVLVTQIAEGAIAAGTRLRETELCRQLGVSRVPLREALRILQAQGIVESIPNRGSFVLDLATWHTTDMLEVRISIECAAFRRAMVCIGREPSRLDGLEEGLQEIRRHAQVRDRLAYAQADLAFHERVVELSDSPILTAAWRSLARGVLFFMLREPRPSFDFERQDEEHAHLLCFLRTGSVQSVESHVRNHILKNLQAAPVQATAS